MELEINEEFRGICKEILEMQKSEEEWAAEESDDMFQSESFSAGYDADEKAFCFSYYDENRSEFWFQLTLDEIAGIARGIKTQLRARPAE